MQAQFLSNFILTFTEEEGDPEATVCFSAS